MRIRMRMDSWFTCTVVFWCAIHGSVVCMACSSDEVTVKISANMECHHCPDCPDGHGLSLKCGSTIKDVSLMKCVPCTAGVNYSESHDHSMCKPCRHCGPHQNKTGQCTPEKDDTTCGRCYNGYYKEVTGNCKECTLCCENEKRNRRMPDCQNAGLSENKQCAQEGPTKSCAPIVSDNEEQKFPIGKTVAIAVGVTVAILALLVIVLVLHSKTREKLKSVFIKCLQCCRSKPSEHPLSTRNNNAMTCTRRGRHRYGFQPSWPFTTGAVTGNFNHSHLSGVHTENEPNFNPPISAPVPVTDQNGETSRDRLQAPESHHYAKVHSYPGYPIRSHDMSGPRKPTSSLFKQMHEQMKSGKSKGFKKFDNEEEDDNPSSSGLQCRPQDYSVDVGGRHHGKNFDRLGDSSTEKDSGTEIDSRSTQRCRSWNHIDQNEPHSSVKDTGNTSVKVDLPPITVTSVKVDPPITEPAVPTVAYQSNHDTNGTAPNPSLEKVLQDLNTSGQYSSSKLSERAGNIPFGVLKHLCPIMNESDIQFNDYRTMGEVMGFGKNSIAAAGQSKNPTEQLLRLFDSKMRGTVGHVMAILKVMDRDDAFRVLGDWCQVTHDDMF